MSTEASARRALVRALRGAGAAAYAIETGGTAAGFPDVAAQVPALGAVLIEVKRADWPQRKDTVRLRVGRAQPPCWKSWAGAGGRVALAARVGRAWLVADAEHLARRHWDRRASVVELDVTAWPRADRRGGLDREALIGALGSVTRG